MGKFHRSTLAACVLAAIPLADAQGAGHFRYPAEPVMSVADPIAIPEYSAWYLRGDMGYAFHDEPDLSQVGATFSSSNIDGSWSIGGGLSYRFSDNVLVDAGYRHLYLSDVRLDATATTLKTDI